MLALPVPVPRYQGVGTSARVGWWAIGDDVHFTATTRRPTDLELEKATHDWRQRRIDQLCQVLGLPPDVDTEARRCLDEPPRGRRLPPGWLNYA